MNRIRKVAAVLCGIVVATCLATGVAMASPAVETAQAATSYKIIYKLDGGKQAAKQVTKVKKGKTVAISKIKAPKKADYKFAGWYKNAKRTVKATKVVGAVKKSGRTLYAKWVRTTPLVVVVDKGASDENGPLYSLEIGTAGVDVKAGGTLDHGTVVTAAAANSDGSLVLDVTVGLDRINEVKITDPVKFANLRKIEVTEGESDAQQLVPLKDFTDFTNATTMNLAKLDMTGITALTSTFQEMDKLTTLNLDNWKTTDVTDFRKLAYKCKSLTSVSMKNWDLTNTVRFIQAFVGCDKLAEVDMTGWKMTGNLRQTYSMFNGCKSLKALDLSGWSFAAGAEDEDHDNNMSSMFKDCASLESLDLSSWKVPCATSTHDMFNGCKSLTTVGDISGWGHANRIEAYDMFTGSGIAEGVQPTWYKELPAENLTKPASSKF